MKNRIIVTIKNNKVFNLFGRRDVIHGIMGDTPKWVTSQNGQCRSGWDYSMEYFDRFLLKTEFRAFCTTVQDQ